MVNRSTLHELATVGGGREGRRKKRKEEGGKEKKTRRKRGWEMGERIKKKKKEWQIQEVVSYGSMCNAVAFLDGTKVDLFVPDVDILDGLSPYPDSYRSVVFLVIFFCFLFFPVFFSKQHVAYLAVCTVTGC